MSFLVLYFGSGLFFAMVVFFLMIVSREYEFWLLVPATIVLWPWTVFMFIREALRLDK